MEFKANLIKLLVQIGVALLPYLGVGGFWGIVAKFGIKIIAKSLAKLGVSWNEKLKAAKALKKYEEIINNPNTTPEERLNADRDFIAGKS